MGRLQTVFKRLLLPKFITKNKETKKNLNNNTVTKKVY